MTKQKSWTYLLFGLYPMSLFALAHSRLSRFTQIIILSTLALSLLIVANLFQILNVMSILAILLFVLAPYVIGKQMK